MVQMVLDEVELLSEHISWILISICWGLAKTLNFAGYQILRTHSIYWFAFGSPLSYPLCVPPALAFTKTLNQTFVLGPNQPLCTMPCLPEISFPHNCVLNKLIQNCKSQCS